MRGDADTLKRRGAAAMLALLIVSLGCGMLVPLYTDEVGWRFQLSRYFQDGGIDRFIGEACGANTFATPAWFMVPVRAFSSAVTAYTSDPIFVRIAGVLLAILGVLGLRVLVRRGAADSDQRGTIEMLSFALLGLGVLPFLLVWSRPEQPVWLTLIGALLIATKVRFADDAEPVLPAIGIVLLACIAMSYHLKALFYVPVFILAIGFAGGRSRRWYVRGAACAVLLGAAWVAYLYWSRRFACPADTLLAVKLQHENASTLVLAGDWSHLRASLPKVAAGMWPELYVQNALPATAYMSSWLPGTSQSFATVIAWRLACYYAWFASLLAGAAALVLGLRERRWMPLVIALTLAGCATAWAALQLNKNTYESALYLPVLVLALAYALAAARPGRWLSVLAWGVAVVSAASQIVLIASYGPRLWAAGRQGGYVASQPYSVSAFGYARLRPAIVAAGGECGIGPKAKRVLIDDVTYFAFAQSDRPMHRLGVLSTWNGSIRDPLAYMRAQGSAGAVIGCRYLPPALRAKAKASGDFCCLAAP